MAIEACSQTGATDTGLQNTICNELMGHISNRYTQGNRMGIHYQHIQEHRTIPTPTFKQWRVSFLENILNLVSSPINLTVLFFVSMLIWSFFLT